MIGWIVGLAARAISLGGMVARRVNCTQRDPSGAVNVPYAEVTEWPPWQVGTDGAFIEDFYFELALD